MAALSKTNAECAEKYFSKIKFSTHVLISLWKSGLERQLTSPSST
jgi:hypothetical protein